MKLNQYIAALPLLLLLSGCKIEGPQNTLSGNGEKTPLRASALLDAGGADVTRAAGKEFDNGDKLLAYVRHVKWEGGTSARELVTVQNSPKLVTFTATGNTPYTGEDIKPIGLGGTIVVATKTNEATNQATTLTADPALYWDDFSEGAKGDEKDIRTAGHYLQSYYGYCFNGGEGAENAKGATVQDHITTALTEATGVLGWNVSADQTDAENFKKSDLLWSAEQTPVAYAHAEAPSNSHGTLLLPYTHAMSKVTIHVTVDKGFASDYSLSSAAGTLHDQFERCTCTAPTNKISAHTGNQNIQMKRTVPAENKKVTFEAIIVPSILSVGNNFATISTGGTDADKYQIPVTQNMITSWKQTVGAIVTLRDTTERIINGVAQAPGRADASPASIPVGKGYAMVSGVNYVLNVTIDKQDVTVSATIRDWVDVEAEGTAIVQFAGDVTEKGTIQEELKEKGLDVYKSNSNTEFTTKSTSLTWSTYANQWIYDPAIYWAGQGDASYFRALSPKGTTTSLTQGNDILWGTSGDEAIAPRTGDVPLEFEHPMSKITVNLVTAEGDYNLATCPAVNLAGAKMEITHLATTGTLELVKGEITPGEKQEQLIAGVTSISSQVVIPQTIGDDAILKITLADGTVYKLQLNTCVDSNSTDAITAWKRGKHYTYTIRVEKEAITFRAMIKEWAETKGGGNATLEWD